MFVAFDVKAVYWSLKHFTADGFVSAWNQSAHRVKIVFLKTSFKYEPVHEKTNNSGF